MGNCLKSEDSGVEKKHEKEPSDKENVEEFQEDQSEQRSSKNLNKPKGQIQKSGVLQQKKTFSWDKKKKLKLADFMFTDLDNQFDYKQAGQVIQSRSINGQQFIIKQCKQSDLYIHDYSADVKVDDSQACVIVIGPCTASVFIRDCKNLKMVVICQQLRMRDCHNCQIMLYSQTDPVIESSSKIEFWCLAYSYPQLRQQFITAKLSIWNNNWSKIFDFTPKGGKCKINQLVNYTLHSHDDNQFITPLSVLVQGVQQLQDRNDDSTELDLQDIQIEQQITCPITTGLLDMHQQSVRLITKSMFCLFMDCSTNPELLYLYENIMAKVEGVYFKKMKETIIRDPQQFDTLIEISKLPISKTQKKIFLEVATKGPIVGWYICSQLSQEFHEAVTQIKNRDFQALRWISVDKHVEQTCQYFFEELNEEHKGHNIAQ